MATAWRSGLAGLCLALAVPGAAGAEEEIRPSWLTVETDTQRVKLLMVGAADGSNGTMNFNGYGRGEMTVVVPFGWKVEVEFQNRGLGVLPHSLVVIDEVSPLPIEGGVPAFPRALTRRLVPGMMAGETDSFDFLANKQGRFLFFCGVTAHGTAGMWDYLVVSREAEAPRVLVKSRK